VSDVTWLSDDEQCVWRTLLSVHARLLGRLDDELQTSHGLSLSDYDVLVQLSESPGRCLRMAELAERTMLSPSGITRRVTSLVRQGLVARQTVPDDGRGFYAMLTDQGLARLQEAAPTHVAGVRRYLIAPVTGAGLEGLQHGLDAVAEALTSSPVSRRRPRPS
jgi:DNA-binding MarR family transcriptional regulator